MVLKLVLNEYIKTLKTALNQKIKSKKLLKLE